MADNVWIVLMAALPLVLAAWFVRTLSTIAGALVEIAQRMASIEDMMRSGGRRADV